jgi:hypothetical protein
VVLVIGVIRAIAKARTRTERRRLIRNQALKTDDAGHQHGVPNIHRGWLNPAERWNARCICARMRAQKINEDNRRRTEEHTRRLAEEGQSAAFPLSYAPIAFHYRYFSRKDTMKPLPAPNVPGNTDAERMSNALTKVLSVSKADLLKKEAKWKRDRERKKRTKPS